ncbi:endogalactanase [Flagelloscypha sp. PMI_526]|nr:endogalactanase [Flagelloscypha sp. PMI_526]
MLLIRTLVLSGLLGLVHALTYKAADISSLLNLESSGRKYYETNGTETALEKILVNHGANMARIRIWTSTSYSSYSTAYGLALAKRAYAAGLQIMVDLHYSDTWADPGNQAIPSSWPTTLSGLNTQIYTYTKDIVTQFANQGTPIAIIAIGNEISDGFLWPVGKASTSFDGVSQLLHSAATAVRAASSSTKIMVHLANGWKYSDASWFWSNIFRQGEFATSDVDIMGFSFYPFYGTSATYANLKSSLSQLVSTYGKDVFVAETDWPVSCSGVTMSESSIAISAAGQQTWVNGIKTVLTGIGSHGVGIAYWEPAWIGNGGLGSSCSDNLLVDSSGKARSSIAMFSANM